MPKDYARIGMNKEWVKNGQTKEEHPAWKGGKRKKYWVEPYKRNPWSRIYKNITTRCFYDKKCSYYGRVKNYLTIKQIKYLWYRDKGWLMKKPSIERRNNRKHYTIRNCRIIELKENITGKRGKQWKRIKSQQSKQAWQRNQSS